MYDFTAYKDDKVIAMGKCDEVVESKDENGNLARISIYNDNRFICVIGCNKYTLE